MDPCSFGSWCSTASSRLFATHFPHSPGAAVDTWQYRKLPGIDELCRELDRAEVVEPDDVPAGLVTMNLLIRFRDEVANQTYELILVDPDSTDTPRSVSVLAPIDSALLGLSDGQLIAWQVLDGRQLELRVLDVIRQPESSGEYHR